MMTGGVKLKQLGTGRYGGKPWFASAIMYNMNSQTSIQSENSSLPFEGRCFHEGSVRS